MVDRAVARRYAEAFVNAQQNAGRIEAGLQELIALAKTYSDSQELRRFLGSPEIAEEEKWRILSRLWSESVGAEAMGLLNLLLRWDRMDHLPAVAQEAQSVTEIRQGILRGTVTTAHPISNAETETVARAVGKVLGKRVILERHVESGLIGGVRVVVGTTVLDGSVRTRLEEVRRQLAEAKVN